jgi:prophage maintenance system killer protein
VDTFECAAAYAVGIAKAHSFTHGNNQIAFVKSVTFMCMNGWHFVTDLDKGFEFIKDRTEISKILCLCVRISFSKHFRPTILNQRTAQH